MNHLDKGDACGIEYSNWAPIGPPHYDKTGWTRWQTLALLALTLGAVKIANEFIMTHEYEKQAKALERIAFQMEEIDARVVNPH